MTKRIGVFILITALVATAALADIDTANKRGSVPIVSGVYRALPVPDSAIDAGDRAQLAYLYRGFLDSEETPPESTGSTPTGRVAAWFILHRRR